MATAKPRMDVDAVLAELEKLGSKKGREDMLRYGIVTPKAFGVPMAKMQVVAKKCGKDHALAEALWKTGWYEARMVASMVGEADRVTPAQMERWCKDFDNWGICDTVCFKLWDRTPHAWAKMAEWAGRREEFVKRTAFALLWSLVPHDKVAPDEKFLAGLELVEREACDDRHFVKKAVNMALRAVGKRNARLRVAAAAVARRLAASTDPTARWIGKDALREIGDAAPRRRSAAR